LLSTCWLEKPEERPNMDSIVDTLQRLYFSMTNLPTSSSAPSLLESFRTTTSNESESIANNNPTNENSKTVPTLRTAVSESNISEKS